MELKNKIDKIFITIFVIFGFFGALYLSVVVHEYSHFADYYHLRDNFKNEEICVQTLPMSFGEIFKSHGYYTFELKDYDEEIVEEINRINRTTELKAYSFSIFIILIFLYSYIVFLDKNIKRKDEVFNYEI